MNNYDNNIEMFDAYLNNTMSEDAKKAFEKQLAENKELKQDFATHKEIIYLLQKSCGEANREFGQALKRITDEDYEAIVGRKTQDSAAMVDTTADEEKPKEKVIPLKKVYRWMSIAAMLFIIAGVGVNQYQLRHSRNQAYDAIYATGFNPDNLLDASRAEGEMTQTKNDLNNAIKLMDKEPEKAAQQLEVIFKSNAADAQDMKIDCGIALAYAYVKTHDIDKAKNIIQKVEQLNDGLLPEELENLQRALNNLQQ